MLLSRVDLIPRFNNFIRQISKGSALLKQNPVEFEKYTLENKQKEDKTKHPDSGKPTNPNAIKKTNNHRNDSDIPSGPKTYKTKFQNNKNEKDFKQNSFKNENSNTKTLTDTLKLFKKERDINYSIKNLFDEPLNEKDSVSLKKKSIKTTAPQVFDAGLFFKEANKRTLDDLKVIFYFLLTYPKKQ